MGAVRYAVCGLDFSIILLHYCRLDDLVSILGVVVREEVKPEPIHWPAMQYVYVEFKYLQELIEKAFKYDKINET